MFGHLNNAVYLELFDSVLNAWMQAETGIDENTAPTLGVVAETSCRYYREVSFPVTVEVGVRSNRLGRTSVLFEFGVFLPDDEQIAAHGLWAQVYVDRVTRRPVPIPDAVRATSRPRSPGARSRRGRRGLSVARPPAATDARHPVADLLLRACAGPVPTSTARGPGSARGATASSPWSRSPDRRCCRPPTGSPTPTSPPGSSTAGARPTTRAS